MLASLLTVCLVSVPASPSYSDDSSAVDFTTLVGAELKLEPTAEPSNLRLGMIDDAASTMPEVEPEVKPFGTVDTARWNLLGGAGHNLDDDSEAFLGVGLSYFVATRLSFEIELNGWYFNVEDGSAWGINGNLLIRWHFWQSNDLRWTLFGDAGAGLLASTDNVPSTGSDFNFTPQLGGGFSLDIGNDNRLLAGVRWHHVSNANTSGHNPGQDNLLFFAGVSFPF